MSEFDISLPTERVRRLQSAAVVTVSTPAVFRITGAGALQCLQGLLTNDVVTPGDRSLIYGALLTPKGMIVVDYWVIRGWNELLLLGDPRGHDTSVELFARSLPPRLAQVADLTNTVSVVHLFGTRTVPVLTASGLGAIPQATGQATEGTTPAGTVRIALAPEQAPFRALIAGETPAVELAVDLLLAHGAQRGGDTDAEAARILAGWPALGAEIDEKTLPQEVRYDEIGGVSYTKGCYTGQETVARLHFRGHTNRELRGLVWLGAEPLDGRAVVTADREVGTIRSTLTTGDRILGLAPIRREIPAGETVRAGGREATVTFLPFEAGDLPR